MIEINVDGGVCTAKTGGFSLMVEAEAVAASIALIKIYARQKEVSFETASLLLMQQSNKMYSLGMEIQGDYE